MSYKRKCWWCEKEFETDDIDLDYCSISCYDADVEDEINRLEEEREEAT